MLVNRFFHFCHVCTKIQGSICLKYQCWKPAHICTLDDKNAKGLSLIPQGGQAGQNSQPIPRMRAGAGQQIGDWSRWSRTGYALLLMSTNTYTLTHTRPCASNGRNTDGLCLYPMCLHIYAYTVAVPMQSAGICALPYSLSTVD